MTKFLLAVLLTGCSATTNPVSNQKMLIGTWRYAEGTVSYQIRTFADDGTFTKVSGIISPPTSGTETGTYTATDTSVTQLYSGITDTCTYTVTNLGKTLKLVCGSTTFDNMVKQ